MVFGIWCCSWKFFHHSFHLTVDPITILLDHNSTLNMRRDIVFKFKKLSEDDKMSLKLTLVQMAAGGILIAFVMIAKFLHEIII